MRLDMIGTIKKRWKEWGEIDVYYEKTCSVLTLEGEMIEVGETVVLNHRAKAILFPLGGY